MKNKFFLWVLLLTLSFCNCKAKTTEDSLKVETTRLVFSTIADSRTISCSSNARIETVSSHPAWCTAQVVDVNRGKVIVVSASRNEAPGQDRTATVTVTAGKADAVQIEVKQTSHDVVFNVLADAELQFGWQAAQRLLVQSNVPVTATSSAPEWCRVAEHSNSYHLDISVTENLDKNDRTAEVTVTAPGFDGVTITVFQRRCGLAYMYAYGPYNQTGANIFGTIVCDFEKSDPGRNSHGGPVSLQYPNGDLVAFYTNCSGHNTDGWSEYSVSRDGGRTWNMNNRFAYSYNAYQTDRNYPVCVERGLVTAERDAIVLFISHLVNTGSGGDGRTGSGFMRSTDNGQTWSAYQPLDGNFVGYPVATATEGSTNYVLYDENDFGPHVLYVSTDNGLSWNRRSTLTLENAVWYGTMCFMNDGRLIAGGYKEGDNEHYFFYCISNDHGVTWGPQKKAWLDKRCRNQKIACLGEKYFLCGRSGEEGAYQHQFVMYQSDDGENWDTGIIVNSNTQGSDGYSDVCIIDKGEGAELMVVYSIAYRDDARTNEYVFFVK